MTVMLRRATYAGRCFRCHQPIRPGDMIWWSTNDRKARHEVCPPTRRS